VPSFEQSFKQSFVPSFERSFVLSFVQSFCRALVELRAELRAGLPLSFVPQSSRKAPQVYTEGWWRGRKRSALVFTERLGGAEVELGPLRRRLPLNVARV
jgi:hypothetical protein